MNPATELAPQLKQLRLSGILDSLDARNRQAIDSHLAYTEFLALLIQDEVARRLHVGAASRWRGAEGAAPAVELRTQAAQALVDRGVAVQRHDSRVARHAARRALIELSRGASHPRFDERLVVARCLARGCDRCGAAGKGQGRNDAEPRPGSLGRAG